MAKPSRLLLAKDNILSFFSENSQKVYTQSELSDVLLQNRDTWELANRTSSIDFISFLIKVGSLRAHKFISDAYNQEITRYAWGKVSLLKLAIALRPRAYLCHGTATALHGLTKQSHKTIYVNVEQSPKPRGNGSLTQGGD